MGRLCGWDPEKISRRKISKKIPREIQKVLLKNPTNFAEKSKKIAEKSKIYSLMIILFHDSGWGDCVARIQKRSLAEKYPKIPREIQKVSLKNPTNFPEKSNKNCREIQNIQLDNNSVS